jgi:hypothetical protein
MGKPPAAEGTADWSGPGSLDAVMLLRRELAGIVDAADVKKFPGAKGRDGWPS